MTKTTKNLLLYSGVAALLLGVITFIIPYLEDAANRMIRSSSWWTTHSGAVAWFWGPSDPSLGLFAPFWEFAVGLIVAGLVLCGTSVAVKG
ncbi:MAG: hypothetical protein ABSA92_16025 [Candidatus Bathyarchaeia archaeon]